MKAYISDRQLQDILNDDEFSGQMYSTPSKFFNKQITLEVNIADIRYNNKSTNKSRGTGERDSGTSELLNVKNEAT